MQQQQIDLGLPQPRQRALGGALELERGEMRGPNLGGDEHFAAGEAGCAQPLPHLALVVVHLGRVDVAVAQSQRLLDDARASASTQLPGAQTHERDAGAFGFNNARHFFASYSLAYIGRFPRGRKRNHLSLRAVGELRGSTRARQGSISRAASIPVGRRVEAVDVSTLIQNRSLGREVDGLLGMSFLSRFNLSKGRRDWTLSRKRMSATWPAPPLPLALALLGAENRKRHLRSAVDHLQ